MIITEGGGRDQFCSIQSVTQSLTETMSEKRKRTQLSLADNLKILDRLKNGEKKEKIMSDFDIVLRTLQRIAKNESQIRQDSLTMQSTQKRKHPKQNTNPLYMQRQRLLTREKTT